MDMREGQKKERQRMGQGEREKTEIIKAIWGPKLLAVSVKQRETKGENSLQSFHTDKQINMCTHSVHSLGTVPTVPFYAIY